MLEHRPRTHGPSLRLVSGLAFTLALAATTARADMSKLPRTEVKGTVVAVDADEGALSLKTADGKELALDVVDETRIMVGGKAGALLDVKRGSEATISIVEPPDMKGRKVAYQITVS